MIPGEGRRLVDIGRQTALWEVEMQIAGSVLIAFSAGVFIGVVVMAMMFVASAVDDANPPSHSD